MEQNNFHKRNSNQSSNGSVYYQNFINGQWSQTISMKLDERRSSVAGKTIVQILWSVQDGDVAIQAKRGGPVIRTLVETHARTRRYPARKTAEAVRADKSGRQT